MAGRLVCTLVDREFVIPQTYIGSIVIASMKVTSIHKVNDKDKIRDKQDLQYFRN